MFNRLLYRSRVAMRSVCMQILSLVDRIPGYAVKVLAKQGAWVVCEVDGLRFKLDPSQYVDGEILRYGVFEPYSVSWVKQIVKPEMVVIDVGANFGYYSLLCSSLVGEKGHVFAFEPSVRFRSRLEEHIKINNRHNITVVDRGLSDKEATLHLFLGGDSASFHWVGNSEPLGAENVTLTTLDEFVRLHSLARLDFVKVDIDGHEPQFLDGARETLMTYRPIILMEFMQLALMKAGSGVQDLAKRLKDMGYLIQSEQSKVPFKDQREFLVQTMNCAYSVNVLCFPRKDSSQ